MASPGVARDRAERLAAARLAPVSVAAFSPWIAAANLDDCACAWYGARPCAAAGIGVAQALSAGARQPGALAPGQRGRRSAGHCQPLQGSMNLTNQGPPKYGTCSKRCIAGQKVNAW